MSDALIRDLPPIHPGLILDEVLAPALKRAGVARADLAVMLGMSRANLAYICKGEQPIRPEMALRLGRICGASASAAWWLKLQARFDLAVAEERLGDELAALPDLSAAPMPRAA